MGEVKVTLASTNGLEDQPSQTQPATHLLKRNNAAQLIRAGTLSIIDTQLLKNQVGQLEKGRQTMPKDGVQVGTVRRISRAA